MNFKLVLAFSLVFLIPTCTRCSESTSDSSERLFIATSHNTSQCPQRFLGEPCLTLQQFFSLWPRKCSNATLMLESGSHFVCAGESISFHCNTGLNFVMTAEDATILTYCPFQLSIHITTTGYTHINGITFTSSNIDISIGYAEEVIVSDCNFVGTSISLSEVINATFLRCTFSDYSINKHDYNDIIILGLHPIGALSIHQSTTVSIVQCTFTNNDIAIYYTMYSYRRASQPKSFYISQSAFINNRASETFDKSGAAIFIEISHYFDYVSTSYYDHHFLLYIWDSTFINNTSQYTGGAVYISGDWCTLSIHHSTFINNTAGTSAGAIHVTGGNTSLSLTENTFIHNSANRCGALSINKVRDINITEIAHNIFSYNSALSEIDNGGGAMCIKGSSSIAVHVTNCTFFSNEAKTYGGAIVLTATTTIYGSVFTHNTAGYNGGAVSVNILHDNCTFTGNAFSSNWAHNDGGAISVSHSGTFSIEMCNFTDNVASNRGGAIVLHRSTMEITRTHMHNNLARIGRDINSCNSNVTSDTKFRRDNDCSYHVNTNTN